MKKVLNGWRVVCGWEVFVENDKIVRAMKKDANGSRVTAYPYRRVPGTGWTLCAGISVAAFRSAVYRGTVTIK